MLIAMWFGIHLCGTIRTVLARTVDNIQLHLCVWIVSFGRWTFVYRYKADVLVGSICCKSADSVDGDCVRLMYESLACEFSPILTLLLLQV